MTAREKGFTLVEVVVVVLVIGLFAFIGIRTWGSYSSRELATDTQSTDTVRQIKSKSDVEAVEKQLDTIDVVGSFEKDLDAEMAF